MIYSHPRRSKSNKFVFIRLNMYIYLFIYTTSHSIFSCRNMSRFYSTHAFYQTLDLSFRYSFRRFYPYIHTGKRSTRLNYWQISLVKWISRLFNHVKKYRISRSYHFFSRSFPFIHTACQHTRYISSYRIKRFRDRRTAQLFGGSRHAVNIPFNKTEG